MLWEKSNHDHLNSIKNVINIRSNIHFFQIQLEYVSPFLIHKFRHRSSDLNGISLTTAIGTGKRDSIEVTRPMPKFAADDSLLIDLSI